MSSLTETLLDALNKLLTSTTTTTSVIVFGNAGRYHEALEHALGPHVIQLDDDDEGFLYNGRRVTLVVEPDFGQRIYSQQLVLTSHLDLKFNPKYTQVVVCHMPTLQTTAPNSKDRGDSYLVTTNNPHEAYLQILTRAENTPRPWYVVMKQALRNKWKAPLERSEIQCRKWIEDKTLLNHYFGFV